MKEYFDKNGKKIKAGMTLRHDDGETREIVKTVSSVDGSEDLGMSCSIWEAYPLWQFNLSEWEIAQDLE